MDDLKISSAKKILISARRVARVTVVLAAELAVVAVLGGAVGSYISNKSIAADCARVNMAKVGDVYLRCTVIEKPNELANSPPDKGKINEK